MKDLQMDDKFEILKNYDTWILKFSGGLDSTLILHYMKKVRTNQEVWLATGVNDNEHVYNGHARDIVKALNVENVYHLLYPQPHFTGKSKYTEDYKFYERCISLFHKDKTIVIQGRTKNPPFTIDGEEKIRNNGGKELENILGFTVYRPWANVDKKQIIESYQEQQIENLIPLTRSCISFTEDECKECFWCKEREWAIGQ
jgi:7-cyano-7-deazaguanine synthase in queuosine biosynthesis